MFSRDLLWRFQYIFYRRSFSGAQKVLGFCHISSGRSYNNGNPVNASNSLSAYRPDTHAASVDSNDT
ncbi:hypothetical protein Hypma_004939 [Hypsizygus marmoreus]|uniref:Uncharacterized protein n=1 Tax=Hypsizygus marmoreus TaxID=39966 RepID=A0A369K022_HYPMA|nr:hypothetical protein Hypma_004939 [Hypsizygus marmoreus]